MIAPTPNDTALDDLTATRLCAEAAEIRTWDEYGKPYCKGHSGLEMQYWPLTNDAQAMALVKRFPPECVGAINEAWLHPKPGEFNINRTVVYCVAAMQATDHIVDATKKVGPIRKERR